ncbi:MAG: hypothetical protein ACYTGB_06885 [Planctomycetota bacterium]|jgi:hypothetical protein
MTTKTFLLTVPLSALLAATAPAGEGEPPPPPAKLPALADQEPNTWLKRSPRAGAPKSPRKGYESSWDWDPYTKRIIRHGGHNQGGGGAQYFEVWTLDPVTMKWELRQPNTSPPGVCCEKDNVFDHAARRFVRFPAFSNSHGWQWTRMISLRNWSAWSYDNAKNTWRNMRPLPHVGTSPGRCASYDFHNDCTLVFDKKTKIYDLYTNTWTVPKPPKQPAGRSYGHGVYDRGRRRHVMFGRHYGNDPVTWAYDMALGQWVDLKTATHPPSNRTSPVMSYDTRNQVIVCVLRTDDKDSTLQTWLYDCRENTWKKLEPGGENLGSSGNRSRLMCYVPELDVHLMENRTKSAAGRTEQQIWTFRWTKKDAPPLTSPGAPLDLAVEVGEGGEAKLTWKPGPGPKPKGYRLFRGTAEVPWKAKYAKVGPDLIAETSFTDKGLAKGKIHYYRVAAVGEDGRPGDESIPARTQPRVLDRLVVSVLGEKEVEVSWKKHPAPDVVGYNVYRADVEVYTADQINYVAQHEDRKREGPPPVGAVKAIGRFKKVNADLITETTMLDKAVDLTQKGRKVEGEPLYRLTFYGKPYEDTRHFNKEAEPYRFAVYAYRVRAVNALGVESGPSPWFLTVPGAPENLFTKEDGGTVHMKWDANPEKKLKGYSVYRMHGRYVQRTKVSRLNKVDEPVTELKYSDTTSGKTQRRFFVVAVDALGQEGVPSSPSWSYREWHKYYTPFDAGLGTWHQ